MSDSTTSRMTVDNDPASPECFVLSGSLNRDTVPYFWRNSLQQLASAQSDDKPLTLDLHNVEHIDTAGLAWIMNLRRDTKQKNIQFKIANPPATLLNLAKISDVERFLPIQ